MCNVNSLFVGEVKDNSVIFLLWIIKIYLSGKMFVEESPDRLAAVDCFSSKCNIS